MPQESRKTRYPEWASRVIALRLRMGISQSELGKQLNSSAIAVSRWERGVQEPPANIYIQLGNITGDPECRYFWAISSRDWRIVAKILWWIGRASPTA